MKYKKNVWEKQFTWHLGWNEAPSSEERISFAQVEGPEFSRAMVDQLQYLFQEFAESKRDDMKEDFETLVSAPRSWSYPTD